MAKTKEERAAYHKKWYAANAEKMRLYRKEYRAKNADARQAYNESRKDAQQEYFRAYAKKRRQQNPGLKREEYQKRKLKNPEGIAAMRRRGYEKHVTELSDGYVKRVLVFGNNLKPADIPQELVDVKRIQIKIQREIKNAKRNATA